jgi:hypothetical protein
MTAATATAPHRFGLHARGMAVGLASGLAAVAFTALLPDAVAYLYLGAQLAGVGWVCELNSGRRCLIALARGSVACWAPRGRDLSRRGAV